MNDRCNVCGATIPKGKQVCPICETTRTLEEYQAKRMSRIDPEYPCYRCTRKGRGNCATSGWKSCVCYIQWFHNIWHRIQQNAKSTRSPQNK